MSIAANVGTFLFLLFLIVVGLGLYLLFRSIRPGTVFATHNTDGFEPGLTNLAHRSFENGLGVLIGTKLLEPQQADALRGALADLQRLQGYAELVLHDPGYGKKWLDFIDREWPWDFQFKHMPWGIDIGRCYIHFQRPGAPLLAAWVARIERPPFAQAVGAYLRRAEPLTRTLRAIESWEGGLLELEHVATVARWAAQVTAPGAVGGSLIEAFANGPCPLPPGPVPIPGTSLIPIRPPIRMLLDPCNLEWLECAQSLGSTAALMTISLPPPLPADVEPRALCSDATTDTVRLTLHGRFATKPVNWTFSVAGRIARNLTWSPTECSGDIVGPLPPGCIPVFWMPEAGEFPDPRSACQGFFGPWPSWWRVPIANAGSFSVVWTAEIKSFTAGLPGQPASPGPRISVEPCQDIELRWEVDDPHVCDSSLTRIRLLADGVVLKSGLPLVGVELVNSGSDVTYRLVVDNTDGSAVCATRTTSLLVAREKPIIRLSGPADVPAGGTGTFVISISCPAPTDGLMVTISSTPSTAVTAPAVTISSGQTKVRVEVTVANACGMATLFATAPNHSPGSAALRILAPPHILSVSGADELQACKVRDLVTLSVGCVTDRATVHLRMRYGKRYDAIVTNRSAHGSDPFAGPVTLTVTLPGVPSGNYALEVEDQGRTTSTLSTIVVEAAPQIVSAPSEVGVNWDKNGIGYANFVVVVVGADRLEVKNPQVSYSRDSSGNSCPPWMVNVGLTVRRGEPATMVAVATETGRVESSPKSVSFNS